MYALQAETRRPSFANTARLVTAYSQHGQIGKHQLVYFTIEVGSHQALHKLLNGRVLRPSHDTIHNSVTVAMSTLRFESQVQVAVSMACVVECLVRHPHQRRVNRISVSSGS